ncbi:MULTISPECIES: hypothetical protein [Hungatella]|uniref:Galactose mutarotase n=1 Tax=Hungatella hathewayi TaxID=154046 RepID=A0AA37JIP0_9FIRM|nr:hypothetical protein [Hungatella hathewayi]GKH01833.1 galactose mutarotase [Hungatella hathewayi]GKH11309.1 galactose mutarotase [Hungatella hathewayi]
MIYTIENKYFKLEANDEGAELWSILDKREDGRPIIWQGDPEVWDEHSPILFPYCGCLKEGFFVENGITYNGNPHGFGKTSIHRVKRISDNSILFSLEADETTMQMYPWNFELETEYRLEEDKIICIFHVHNRDEKDMPFGLGFHTGYCCPFSSEYAPSDYRIKFEKSESPIHLQHNENGNLTGKEVELFHENNFLTLDYEQFPQSFILSNVHSRYIQIEEIPTGRYVRMYPEGAPEMALWSQPDRASYVCIQPWYSAPDSADSDHSLWHKKDIQILKAGESRDYQQIIETGKL